MITTFEFSLTPGQMEKIAAGDIQTFENSLATIGRSFLSPKAPALFKHEIGFQVIDSDDDYERAVGVYGFRVGKKLLYVPLFYRDGVVKGTEQLRDPKRKIAVPLSDNWVNKFLSEQGDEKPAAVSRSDTRRYAQPSLWQLKYPPSKYACAPLELADRLAIQKDLALAIGRPPVPPAALSIDLIKTASEHPKLLEAIGQWATQYQWFSDALDRYHGRSKIASAVAKAFHDNSSLLRPIADPRIIPPLPQTKQADDVTVIRVSTVKLHRVGKPDGPKVESLYNPDEWENLRGGENDYKDNRGPEIKSKVTLWLGGQLSGDGTLANPSQHGIYDVLGEYHEFIKCVVLMPLVGPYSRQGRCLVYEIDGGRWCYTHPNAVWVRGEADLPELGKWADKLPRVKNETDGVPDGRHIAIARVNAAEGAPGFEASTPFTKTEWATYFMSNPLSDRPYWGQFDTYEDNPHIHHGTRVDHSNTCVEVFDEASHMRLSGNQLYVPVGCHMLELGDGKRLKLGDGSDPERVMFSRNFGSGDKKIKLHKMSSAWVLTDPRTDKESSYTEYTDMEADLVESHGLSVPDAKKLTSAVMRNKQAEALVRYGDRYKQADGVKMPDTGLALNHPNSPTLPFDLLSAPSNFADDVVPSETGSSMAIPINDLLSQSTAYDRSRPYPTGYGVNTELPGVGNGPRSTMTGSSDDSRSGGSGDLEAVSAAARSGQRELFDTSALAALVKHKSLSSLLTESRNLLGRAVTGLADLLAHMYWNVEEWSDRFGEGEIGPIEDQMRSQFEKLGDLYLTLQEDAVSEGMDPGVLPAMRPNDASETPNM